jgi:hypothetical protein
MWREAMMELLDQLEAENPEDPALAPKVGAAAQHRALAQKAAAQHHRAASHAYLAQNWGSVHDTSCSVSHIPSLLVWCECLLCSARLKHLQLQNWA